MKNYTLIATAYNNEIRIYSALTTSLVEHARVTHNTWPTATAAFGRFLTASAMMGLMYKDEETITLKIKGDGPINTMIAHANARGEIKGDIFNPHVYLRAKENGKLDVGKAVGNGFLHVTKDLKMKKMFSSSSELVSGEIAEDFTHYFAISEQTPSAVSLGVLVNNDQSVRHAGGFIIQVLPGASDETITYLENKINEVGPVSRWLNDGKDIESLISALANNTETILAKKKLSYLCDCSKEGFSKSLYALDTKTLDELISDGEAEIVCHFCKKKYLFSKQELINIKNSH